jgi:hypothetical protein
VDVAVAVGDLDQDVDGKVLFTRPAVVDRVGPTDGVELLATAIRADEDKIRAVKDGDSTLSLFWQEFVAPSSLGV